MFGKALFDVESDVNDRIAFRVVQPLFDPVLPNAIKIFSFDQKLPGNLMELEGTCVGCHGYSANMALFNIKKGTDRRLLKVRPSKQKLN